MKLFCFTQVVVAVEVEVEGAGAGLGAEVALVVEAVVEVVTEVASGVAVEVVAFAEVAGVAVEGEAGFELLLICACLPETNVTLTCSHCGHGSVLLCTWQRVVCRNGHSMSP